MKNKVFSVSEISYNLKRVVEEHFAQVRVRGEISRCTIARSGHLYMSLKDASSVLDAVCWRGTLTRLTIDPEDGVEVIVTGRLTTYAGRSNYQIIIEKMEIAGEGALLKLLEDRRKKLLAEGLFKDELKKPLPYLPQCIGIVTSQTGAVIQDILNRLEDRFPRHVLLWPVNVQGVGAAEEVANAIKGFNKIQSNGPIPSPDLIIVARGGGSVEDLWAFNEEIVVRAAASSAIPLISAIGHETDTTLIDFAADKRASTPSAAAEISVPRRSDLNENISATQVRLDRAIKRMYMQCENDLTNISRVLPNFPDIIVELIQRLDERSERFINALAVYLGNRSSKILNLSSGLISPNQQINEKKGQLRSVIKALHRAIDNFIENKRHQFDKLEIKLESLSFERVLDRGFTLVTNSDGKPILSTSMIRTNSSITVKFRDGDIGAVVRSKNIKRPKIDTVKSGYRKSMNISGRKKS